MTSETDNKVEAAPKPGGIDFSIWAYNTLPERTGNVGWQPDLQDLIYTAINHVEGDYEDADENCAEQVIERLVLAIKSGLADRDTLAAELNVCRAEEGSSDVLYRDERAKRLAAEAKLSALVEAAKPFARWIESARGAPWRAGPVLTANGGAVITVADFDAIRQALASLDRTAPGEEEKANQIGAAEIQVGQYVYRRIETLMGAAADTAESRELDYLADLAANVEEYGARGDEEGQQWKSRHFSPDIPAQEVAGLVEVLAQIIQPIVRRWIYRTAHDGPDHLCSGIAQDAAAAVLSHCAALASSPSQGGETVDRSGVAAADDNYAQAEVSWRAFLASDKDWLADHGRKMGSGVGQQAVERLLIALDHIPADDNHKAMVEETKAEKIARLQCEIAERQAQLRFLVLGDATARVVGVVTQQLAAFTTKGMDHG